MAQRDISDAGIQLIQKFEGLPDGNPATVNLDPYLDPVDIWTIGWGHVLYLNGKRLDGEVNRASAYAMFPDGITVNEATVMLRADLVSTARDVQRLVTVAVNDNEFSSLISFAFNLGTGNLASSTLLKLLNNDERKAAAEQFGRWVLAKGVKLPGLVRRRQAERDLFLTPA